MSQSTKIHEALLNRTEKVSRKSEIVAIITEYKKKFKSSLGIVDGIKYLSRHRYIRRIFAGFYYVNSRDERTRGYSLYTDKEQIFIVLNRLGIRWYVGLNSALYLAGKSWQVPVVLHLLNDSFSGERTILGLKIRFYKIKRSLFVGLTKAKTTHKVDYYFSNLAKTRLDMVYLKKSHKLIKMPEMKKYLGFYPPWIGKR